MVKKVRVKKTMKRVAKMKAMVTRAIQIRTPKSNLPLKRSQKTVQAIRMTAKVQTHLTPAAKERQAIKLSRVRLPALKNSLLKPVLRPRRLPPNL
jgi:hypothetical protein